MAPSILPFLIMAISGWRPEQHEQGGTIWLGFILSDAAVFLSFSAPFYGCLLSVLLKLPRKCLARGLPHLAGQELLRFREMTWRSRISNPLSSLTYHIKHLSDNDVAGITLIELQCTVLGRVGGERFLLKFLAVLRTDWLSSLVNQLIILGRLVLLKENSDPEECISDCDIRKIMCTRATSRCPPAQVWGTGMRVSKFFLKKLFMTSIVHLAVLVNFQLKCF